MAQSQIDNTRTQSVLNKNLLDTIYLQYYMAGVKNMQQIMINLIWHQHSNVRIRTQ